MQIKVELEETRKFVSPEGMFRWHHLHFFCSMICFFLFASVQFIFLTLPTSPTVYKKTQRYECLYLLMLDMLYGKLYLY